MRQERRERTIRGLAAAGALSLAAAAPGSAWAVKALVGAAVHTVAQGVLEPGVVVVGDDGTLLAVGPAGAISFPAGTEVVDLQGQQLYPGMIDAATSLGLTEVAAVAATNDVSDIGELNAQLRAYAAINPDSELIPVARAGGITHALVTPGGSLVCGSSGLVALDGWTWESMLVKGPAALHVEWPAMDLDRSARAAVPAKKQLEQRRERLQRIGEIVREARAYHQARAAERTTKGIDRHDQDVRYEAWGPVLRKEIPAIVHADDQRAIDAALDWARENDVRLVIAGGREADQVAARLVEAHVPVIFYPLTELPQRDFDSYDANYAAPSRLHAAGVDFCIATGGGAFGAAGARNLPDEAGMAVAYGLPPDAAVRAVTQWPAQILGVGDRMGTIEVGKRAHLIATDGDLLDIRTHVTRMWIDGREVSLANRHTRLYEKYRARPKAK